MPITMPKRLLHILSQRPGRSGSGVFLEAMVREAARRGYRQHAVVVGPTGTSHGELPPLLPEELTPIVFPNPVAPFPAPGNSDVMPYASSVFSELSEHQIEQYLEACRQVLIQVRETFQPDLVHAHHLWLLTGLARSVFSAARMVATSHNAELRQMIRAPWLVPALLPGIRAIDRVCVLTPRSHRDTVEAYGVDPARIAITGAGYRPDLFHSGNTSRRELAAILRRDHGIELPLHPDGEPRRTITFIGRLSSSKGLPYLLAAIEQLTDRDCTLLLVGASGSGDDGTRMDALVARAGPRVQHLGAMPQQAVSLVLRCSDLFVLPSLFEGLPLVMLEAAACGCPCLVAALPTIASWAPETWRDTGCFELIPPLGTTEADRPIPADVPRYVNSLAGGIARFLDQPPSAENRLRLALLATEHSWARVFDRYEEVYAEVLA